MTVVTGLTSAGTPPASRSRAAAAQTHGGDEFAALVAAHAADERPANTQLGERRTGQASGEQSDDAAGQDRDRAAALPVSRKHGASHSGTAAAERSERQDDGSSQGAAGSAPAPLTAEVAAGMAAVDPAAPPTGWGTPPPSDPPAVEPLGTPALANPDSTALTGPSPAAPTTLDAAAQATGQPASVPDAAAANVAARASAPTTCAAPPIAPAALNAAPGVSATSATAADHPASAAPQPAEAGSPTTEPADSALSNLTVSGAPAALPTVTANAPTSPDAPAQPVASQLSAEVTALMSRADGTHRIRLRLSPEALGDVSVVLTLRKGAVEVTLGAGAQARLALEESSGELHRLLQLAGAQTTQVVVKDLADSSPTAGLAQGQVGADPGAGDASLSWQLGSGRRHQQAGQRRAAADLRTDGPAAITTPNRTAYPRTSLDICI